MGEKGRSIILMAVLAVGIVVGGVFVGVFLSDSGTSSKVRAARDLRIAKYGSKVKHSGVSAIKIAEQKPGAVCPCPNGDPASDLVFRTDDDKNAFTEVLSDLAEFIEESGSKREAKSVEALNAALAANDADGVVRQLKVLMRSKSPTVRKAAVAASNWLAKSATDSGGGALSELVVALGGTSGGGDIGAGTAGTAGAGTGSSAFGGSAAGGGEDAGQVAADDGEVIDINQLADQLAAEVSGLEKVEARLNECDNDASRIAAIKSGMQSATDQNVLNFLSSALSDVSDKSLAVKAVIELTRSGDENCQNAAKEAYSWLTDQTWTNEKAAQVWLEAQSAE